MERLIIIAIQTLLGSIPFALFAGYLDFAIFALVTSIFLIILGIVLKIRKKKNKNAPVKLSKKFRSKYPIVVQYAPPDGLNSAEAGLLYNCKVEPTDLTSLIYQWAYKGLIEIEDGSGAENMSKIILRKLKEIPDDSPFFERDMFGSIFMGNKDVKVISSSNQLKYALFLEDLQIHGVQKGWFEKKKVPVFIKVLFFLSVLSAIFSIFVKIWLFPIMVFLLVIVSGYVFGDKKIQLTDKGAELVSYIIGYRKFIKECDEKQIQSFLGEDPLFVDRSLPYAIAFGLESQFIKKTTPLVKDWNAKYLCGKKVSTLSEIISGIALAPVSPFGINLTGLLRLLFKS